MPRPGVGNDGVLVVSVVVDDARHRLPAVLDVVKVAPNVAGADDRLVVGLQQKTITLTREYIKEYMHFCKLPRYGCPVYNPPINFDTPDKLKVTNGW